MMVYFKRRMRMLRSEYTKADRREVIAAAGNKCPLCDRVEGDIFMFGPTAYLKKKIRFRVYIDIHVIESSSFSNRNVVMCNGCHISYHMFNRLSEDAEFGVRIDKTVYKRCGKCAELMRSGSCRCCGKCNKAPKWCLCKPKRRSKTSV